MTDVIGGVTEPPFKAISIIVVITDGAVCSLPVKSVHHLAIISQSIYPKRTSIRIICGTNSNQKSSLFLKYVALNAFMQIPKHICKIPRMTESFIFREFKKVSSFNPMYQAGSIPTG